MRTQSVPFGKCFLHSLKNYKVCILYSFLCLAVDTITNRKLWNFTAKLVLSQICLTRYFTQLQSRLQAPIKICSLLHRKKTKIFCFLLKETFFFPCQSYQQCEYFYLALCFWYIFPLPISKVPVWVYLQKVISRSTDVWKFTILLIK